MRVSVSSLQIWQEAVSDLLGERRHSGPLTIREDPQTGVYVAGVTEEFVTDYEELLGAMSRGAESRATAATGSDGRSCGSSAA